MNSRLGLTHPARSKTISGLGTPGGAVNPATASCTVSCVGGMSPTVDIGGVVYESPSSARDIENGAATVGGASEPELGVVVVKRVPGVTKSRTLDLIHYVWTSSAQSPYVSP